MHINVGPSFLLDTIVPLGGVNSFARLSYQFFFFFFKLHDHPRDGHTFNHTWLASSFLWANIRIFEI